MNYSPIPLADSLSALQLGLAFSAFLLGGFSKGVVGFGMPIIAISLMSIAIPVEAALSFNVVVVIILNVFQTGGVHPLKANIRRFGPVLAGIVVGSVVAGTIIVQVNRTTLVGFIGIVTLTFCIHSLITRPLIIPPRHRTVASYVAGGITGLVGTLTGVNGPSLIIYLAALGLEPQTFKRALGLLFLACGILAVAVFSSVGFMTPTRLGLGLLWTLPAAFGMWIGNLLSRRVNPAAFRTIVLIGLMIIAVNLIRRGFF